MHILMTGASGLIGRHLCRALVRRGDQIIAVSRSAKPAQAGITWHVGDAADPNFLRGLMAHCDAAINLAGASVAQRWTAARRREIVDSRLGVTRALAAAMAQSDTTAPKRTLLSASAVGYYGYDNRGPCAETSPPGTGFLATTCQAWEAAAIASEAACVRCVRLRLGVVFAADGGALPQLVAPIRAYVGAALGSGQQWMSWIHIDDVVGLFLHALDHAECSGALNVVAPQAAHHGAVIAAAARALKRPLWAPRVPAAAMRLAMGAMAEEVLLGGQQVVPAAAQATGYAFTHADLDAALVNILRP
jgi:uncharacterized protein (TIGR01777 family)